MGMPCAQCAIIRRIGRVVVLWHNGMPYMKVIYCPLNQACLWLDTGKEPPRMKKVMHVPVV